MKSSRIILASIAVSGLLWVLPSPYQGVKEPQEGAIFLESAQVDPDTLAILKRACRNCHSNDTAWPWYSYVPPVSWLVERDVHQARKFLNFSQWPQYGSAQGPMLGVVRERVEAASMPPRRYVALHPEARLSEEDRHRLYSWLDREAERLAVMERVAW